ncbi:unnamed protein product [Pleuronectes platessa]|uniref:Uncharacterized protein n=1 Tax=Pleuronectes platessa TaxID=8262 RepID=A0A9N7US07_PLEPL|nr:unnamed protein product [Pleuronectes platessa]
MIGREKGAVARLKEDNPELIGAVLCGHADCVTLYYPQVQSRLVRLGAEDFGLLPGFPGRKVTTESESAELDTSSHVER